MENTDAYTTFIGRKGCGMSTSSLAFCESLAEEIVKMRGKGEDPKTFFDNSHFPLNFGRR